jgi:transcriptional regulator of acetoin/glycerol metabolism
VVLTDDALQLLAAHPWPGNVRELRNVLERALLAAHDGAIRARDLAFD